MTISEYLDTLSFNAKVAVIGAVILPVMTVMAIRNIIYWLFKLSHVKKNVTGRIVLITGGAGGVGRSLAVALAKKGAKIVSWDLNEKGNEETAMMITQNGGVCFPQTVDISNKEMIYSAAKTVRKDIGAVDILVNNAGVGGNKAWAPHIPDDRFKKDMDVNFFSHTWTVNAFLPDMIASNSGHIVSISSAAGISGQHFIPYTASKFAVRGFIQSLRLQLHIMGYSGIVVSVFCPGFIDTPLLTEEFGDVSRMPLDEATELLIDAILMEKDFLIIPNSFKFLPFITSFTPAYLLKRAYVYLYWGNAMKKTL